METKITLVPTHTLHPVPEPKEKPQKSNNRSYENKPYKGKGKYQGYRRKYSAKSSNNHQESDNHNDQRRESHYKAQTHGNQNEQEQLNGQTHEQANGSTEDSGNSTNYTTYEQEEVQEYKFTCDFPRVKDYSDKKALAPVFPNLVDVNTPALDIEGLKDVRCFIMRSNNEDDIHKAIKYGIWTSTPKSNDFLNHMYEECTPKQIPIFLFYRLLLDNMCALTVNSVVRSGQFVAVAQLISPLIEKSFQFWWEPNKWVNHFQVKWLFVKDIPYNHFNHLYMDDNFPVTRARDCTNVPLQVAKEMLQIYRDYNPYNSIFNAFPYMDEREDMLRSYRYSLQMYQRLFTAGGSYTQGQTAHAADPSNYQPPQYFKYNAFPNKPASVQTKNQALNELNILLKDFESKLALYTDEKKRLAHDSENVLTHLSANPSTKNSKLSELKSREKKVTEGLEELEIKHQAITQSFNQQEQNIEDKESKDATNERIKTTLASLEKFKDELTIVKNKMVPTYQKIEEFKGI